LNSNLKNPCPAPELPTGWEWVSPDQVASSDSNALAIGPFGSNLKVADYRDSGVPLVFVRHIRAEDFGIDPKFVSSEKAKELKSHSIDPGDVLVTKMGDPPGDSAIYPMDASRAIITADCIKWRIAEQFDTPKYFMYAVRAQVVKRQIEAQTRGVAQKKISLARFKSIGIPIAPLPEQRRIVARIEELFSRLDVGVAALYHAKAQLQRYRQSVLAAAVTGQLTKVWREQHPDTEPASELFERILSSRFENWQRKGKYAAPIAPAMPDNVELPTSWTWISVEQLSSPEKFSLSIGPFGSNLKVSDYRDSGVHLVFVRHIRSNDYNVTPKFISAEKAWELDAHSVDPGDLLITKMGEPPGDASLYPEGRPRAIITADCIKLRLNPMCEYRRFFVNAINSKLVADQIALRTRGVAQKKISLDRFKDVALPLPPLAEQYQIASEVEVRISAINHLDAEIDAQIIRSERLRKSALQEAFRGRLVAQNPTDAPASDLLKEVNAAREAAVKEKAAKEFSKRKELSELVHTTTKEPMQEKAPNGLRSKVVASIKKLEKEQFTFEELFNSIDAEYDDMKEVIFALLEEAKPMIKQEFDSHSKRMILEKKLEK
jgi:type I restriction enzyme S subunit